MAINMEWGGFGSGKDVHAFSLLPFHSVDHELDAASPNPSKQRFEKMISGMYLGEITRRLFVGLSARGALFHSSSSLRSPAPAFNTPGSFTTAHMSDIAEDTSSDLARVGAVLESSLGLSDVSLEYRKIAQELCALVARRAAYLAAAGVAAVLTQIHSAAGSITPGIGSPTPGVAIDGSVYKKYPGFSAWMREALNKLGISCDLTHAEDGSGIVRTT